MNDLMYDRKIEVSVGGQTYTYPDLEINFDIPKTTSSNVDIAEINLYNISDTSINSIVSDSKIVINAGYGNDLGVIFDGYVESVLPSWENVTKVVTILASDVGGKIRSKKIKKSYKNSTTKFIINDLAKILKLKVGEIRPKVNETHQDYAVDGLIYDEIVKLAKESKSKIFTQDDALFVRPFESADDEGIVLNYTSGLIGSPVREEREETKDEETVKIVEYVITTLLNHEIKQDTWVKVESKTLNGKYRVTDVTHTKDFTTVVRVRG